MPRQTTAVAFVTQGEPLYARVASERRRQIDGGVLRAWSPAIERAIATLGRLYREIAR